MFFLHLYSRCIWIRCIFNLVASSSSLHLHPRWIFILSVGQWIVGVISFQKLYGLYGLKHHHMVEKMLDVTVFDNGRTHGWNVKIEREFWKQNLQYGSHRQVTEVPISTSNKLITGWFLSWFRAVQRGQLMVFSALNVNFGQFLFPKMQIKQVHPTPRIRDSYCCSSYITEKSPLWC